MLEARAMKAAETTDHAREVSARQKTVRIQEGSDQIPDVINVDVRGQLDASVPAALAKRLSFECKSDAGASAEVSCVHCASLLVCCCSSS